MNRGFDEAHRCLNETFNALSKLLDTADPQDRRQLLRVMMLVIQAGEEMMILSRGTHRTKPEPDAEPAALDAAPMPHARPNGVPVPASAMGSVNGNTLHLPSRGE